MNLTCLTLKHREEEAVNQGRGPHLTTSHSEEFPNGKPDMQELNGNWERKLRNWKSIACRQN